MNNLNDYPYSSFPHYLAKQGREKLIHQFKTHTDYTELYIDKDDF